MRGTLEGGKHEEERGRDKARDMETGGFSGLSLCARREEAGTQPPLGALGPSEFRFAGGRTGPDRWLGSQKRTLTPV